MKNIVSLLLIICLCVGAISPRNYPSAEITNGIIHAELHLPDAQQGYYRGSRFDWSGVTPRLTFKTIITSAFRIPCSMIPDFMM